MVRCELREYACAMRVVMEGRMESCRSVRIPFGMLQKLPRTPQLFWRRERSSLVREEDWMRVEMRENENLLVIRRKRKKKVLKEKSDMRQERLVQIGQFRHAVRIACESPSINMKAFCEFVQDE